MGGLRLTADGRYASWAVRPEHDVTLQVNELFVFDRVTGITRSFTVGSEETDDATGIRAPYVDPDGGSVLLVFGDYGDFYCNEYDLDTEALTPCTTPTQSYAFPSTVSPNGRFVVYSSNEGYIWWDRWTDQRTSHTNPTEHGWTLLISDDGRSIVRFRLTGGPDDPDTSEFSHIDLATGTATMFTTGGWTANHPQSLSPDGSLVQVVAFGVSGGGFGRTDYVWRPSTDQAVQIPGVCWYEGSAFSPDIGAMCVTSSEALDPADDNGVDDNYLVPIPDLG